MPSTRWRPSPLHGRSGLFVSVSSRTHPTQHAIWRRQAAWRAVRGRASTQTPSARASVACGATRCQPAACGTNTIHRRPRVLHTRTVQCATAPPPTDSSLPTVRPPRRSSKRAIGRTVMSTTRRATTRRGSGTTSATAGSATAASSLLTRISATTTLATSRPSSPDRTRTTTAAGTSARRSATTTRTGTPPHGATLQSSPTGSTDATSTSLSPRMCSKRACAATLLSARTATAGITRRAAKPWAAAGPSWARGTRRPPTASRRRGRG
mmetsp:Transcript_26330/g.69185  ORF Transcript_26330/g.69185 Transcript_26330/m.69185 type:complete len:267 (-) Transcript_26330:1302-2102(-)